MKERLKNFFCQICNAIILAGFIIFFIGFYYYVVKAGIPCQDLPLELQIKYAVNMGIGEILVKNGFSIALCGGLIRLLFWLIFKNSKSGNPKNRS